jgi:hypothetical protein
MLQNFGPHMEQKWVGRISPSLLWDNSVRKTYWAS